MLKASLEQLIRGLNDANVKYLIVGGLAVNAHGYFRVTVDIDLIIQLADQNLRAAIEVLKRMNYRPRNPLAIDQFCQAETRRDWFENKNMKVFSLTSPDHEETEVDIFVDDPLGFDTSYQRAVPFQIAEGLFATVCSYDDLVKLKLAAGRMKDKADLEQLRIARGET